MNAVAMAGLFAGVGLGLLLIIQGFRGRQILPDIGSLFPDGTNAAVATAWFAGAAMSGLMVLAVTRWVGASLGALALVIGLPWFFGGTKINRREIERTQAIASWTEMIRDNLAGAAGLEQALLATADIAPAPIAKEVKAFAVRLESRSMIDALVLLGESLTHASADLVVVSLANASRMEGRDLGAPRPPFWRAAIAPHYSRVSPSRFGLTCGCGNASRSAGLGFARHPRSCWPSR